MKAFVTLACAAFGLATIGAAPDRAAMRGYGVAAAVRERGVESTFVDIPSAQKALDIAELIAARPHYAGSPGDYALAIAMRDSLRGAGIDTTIESFTTRVDTPRRLALALAPGLEPATAPPRRRTADAQFPVQLDLAERPEPSDPGTGGGGIGVPFNSGSADGDVRAPLVYVGTGLDADYTTLERARVDVRGAVVLIRYGAQFRGLLAARAQARGAVGAIFFSDPQDDGAARGPVYPDGPWRPLWAVQRGSVGPGIRIPTLPVSAANAALLLGSLRGSPGPPGWEGALPVAYPLARGPGRVHLTVALMRRTTTLWNTIGVIPGLRSDRRVILGAHRDAWVYGVGDNGAGVSTLLEVGRGLGFLYRGGWRPRRSIVIAGWDGEEIGLAGSRDYALRHAGELERGCVAYLNADQNVSGGRFGADAAEALAPLVAEIAQRVWDPTAPAATVYERWGAQTPGSAPHAQRPGGGSDFEPFLQGLGIPIAEMGFSGPFGVYHSSYDTLRYATLYSDPGFDLHRASAQLYGLAALRIADADVVPYSFTGYADVLRAGIGQLREHAAHEGMEFTTTLLSRAVERFAGAAARIDPVIAQATANDDLSDRALRAAHAVDDVAYGARGYSAVTFARIDAALAAHDAAAVAAAAAHAIDSISFAADTLRN